MQYGSRRCLCLKSVCWSSQLYSQGCNSAKHGTAGYWFLQPPLQELISNGNQRQLQIGCHANLPDPWTISQLKPREAETSRDWVNLHHIYRCPFRRPLPTHTHFRVLSLFCWDTQLCKSNRKQQHQRAEHPHKNTEEGVHCMVSRASARKSCLFYYIHDRLYDSFGLLDTGMKRFILVSELWIWNWQPLEVSAEIWTVGTFLFWLIKNKTSCCIWNHLERFNPWWQLVSSSVQKTRL